MQSHHASLSLAGVALVLHRDNGSPFFSLAVFGSGSIQVLEESVAAQKAMMNRMIWPGIRDEIEISKLDRAVVLSDDTSRAQQITELLRRRSLKGISRPMEIVMQTLSHWIVVLTNAYMEYTTCNWNATHVYRRTVGYDQVIWC
ncbi:hypothetical protein FSB08_03320 [Paraburkholderia sp. JPY432]|uniref:hypothetical protein n=1 Tax=Paraburkholderia youngii TaxID=2782701 RepID=UPI001595E03F|nr:hypothetical protein [Paraburkholderia youngii]NVH71600.1 hypothetical protein [Paraburkholderia youngii]